jgi:RND family efflux transporter MFP subunit
MRRSSLFVLIFALSVSYGFGQGPAQVIVAPVEKRPLTLTQPLVASVEPVTRAILAAEQEGLVSERNFDEGHSIEKGTLLIRMDTELVEIQRVAAAAALQSADGTLKQMEAELDSAKRELVRNRALYETNVAPEKEYLDAETAERVSAARLTIAVANVAEKKAELLRLETILRKSEVRSPLEGVIARRYVEVGQSIKQWEPVADLVQLDPLFVRVNVPEQIIPQVRVGDEASVTIDAINGKEFTGKIAQILPEADPNSRTFAVKILVSNPDLEIRPGFFARAELRSQAETMLLVPMDAIVTQGKAAHVVVARNGAAAIVPVQRGAVVGDKVAVTGELTETDQVVIRGNEALRGGEPLVVIPGDAAPPAEQLTPASQP